MQRQIIINAQERQHHIAMLEDGDLVEYHIDDSDEECINGNIYLGKIDDVLPGLSCAFIDIGLSRNGFLHASDASSVSLDEDFEQLTLTQSPSIEELTQPGQSIIVQVTKDPISDKGPKLTTNISLPGRLVVIIPAFDRVGVSHRIENESERERLRKLAETIRPQGMGLIIRTVAEDREESELRAEIEQLVKIWQDIKARAVKSHAPALLFKNPGKIINLLRDILNDEVSKIITDNKTVMKRIKEYTSQMAPNLIGRIEFYEKTQPIFTHFGIEKELEKMLARKVWLRSGGYIAIDQTEALTAIDVNTGRFVGKRDPEATILKTNLEAARVIAKQVRLRDIGGVIVIDFIDMKKSSHRKEVLKTLTEVTSYDRSRVKILELSELGLVEMTRRRVQESVTSSMFRKCPYCRGEGQILTESTIFLKIEREIQQIIATSSARNLIIRLHCDLKDSADERLIPRLEQITNPNGYKFKLQFAKNLSLDGWEIIIENNT